ncbi:hypothetical protein M406DRAFT_247203 [Cryphonectria parasitica EP155]|uniref:Zn(2)-C6 fungal-type domain-containing protein n=1 Tax=Cryphonectria parasitica (strain ATCC 38755 / EP155) TaxID=660469 RepID=A0A9P4YCE4_CRYP1|nr:uncharacterized protein M406DRAFT_247203 [Cryphonectria parasitica EP155]KAF3770773.1 hypothetical protein M406DRAFT_247203 [Cryphonectria parasitica EP155]
MRPQPTRHAGPRLYHKKSRMGCARCKARRVKVAKPSCGGCSRHQVECVYPPSPASSLQSLPRGAASRPPQVQPAETHAGAGVGDSSSSIDLWITHHDSSSSPVWGENSPPSGHRDDSNRSQSVASNCSSSHTGDSSSAVHEANDYLSSLTDPEVLEIPESRERRMWELRLMHNYLSNQAQQFAKAKATAFHGQQPTPGVALTDEDFIWGRDMPRLAFENDSILYNMLASSALEMWTRTTDPHEKEQLRLLQQKYIAMALRQQRLAVGNLSGDNADMVCMAALTILLNSFALVQTLDLTPWQPPVDWLRMGKGAGAVLTIATGYIGATGNDRITRFIKSGPKMDPPSVFAPENRTHLTWLLENDRGSTTNVGDFEFENNKTALDIYNKILSYIGSVQKAIADKEPIYFVCRRLIGFTMYCPELYHGLLVQRRPRAMITLAHFFKLWIPYDDLWMIGKTGENQVRGIFETLPPEWKHKVAPIFDEYNLEP